MYDVTADCEWRPFTVLSSVCPTVARSEPAVKFWRVTRRPVFISTWTDFYKYVADDDDWTQAGAVLRWGRGGTSRQIHLLPPDSKASWPFWRDFWGPKMLQNPNFPGLRPEPRWRAYSAPPDPLSHGARARCPLPRTPPLPSALWASCLRVSGSNPLQSWQPY